MYIQLERDYNADDNKGLYIHMYDKDTEGTHDCNCGEDERCQECETDDMALIRIENGFIVWYESQNGEYMTDHDDTRRRIGNGDYMNDENIATACTWLSRQFPNADIDLSELFNDRPQNERLLFVNGRMMTHAEFYNGGGRIAVC